MRSLCRGGWVVVKSYPRHPFCTCLVDDGGDDDDDDEEEDDDDDDAYNLSARELH